MKNSFDMMVEICKSYGDKDIMTPIPSQSEWATKNMPLIHTGLYTTDKRPKSFYTTKRHYATKKTI
jgi:hypothetical protein